MKWSTNKQKHNACQQMMARIEFQNLSRKYKADVTHSDDDIVRQFHEIATEKWSNYRKGGLDGEWKCQAYEMVGRWLIRQYADIGIYFDWDNIEDFQVCNIYRECA